MRPQVYHDRISIACESFHECYPSIGYDVWFTSFEVNPDSEEPFLGLNQDAGEDETQYFRWFTDTCDSELVIDGESVEVMPSVILMFPRLLTSNTPTKPIIVINNEVPQNSVFLPFVSALTQLTFGSQLVDNKRIKFKRNELKILNSIVKRLKAHDKKLNKLAFSYSGIAFHSDDLADIIDEINQFSQLPTDEEE